jgi:CubicO group peptidase (beta-lactamase class C family)
MKAPFGWAVPGAFLFLVAPALAELPGKSIVTGAAVERAVATLDQSAEAQIASGTVPGMAIAVVYQDRVLFAKGYGVREVGKPEPIDADTAFQIASVSKPVGSTVVAALVGDGRITWDSRIADLDPSFAMMEPWVTSQITIRDFYSHRSGLPSHAGDLLEDYGYDRGEVLHRLRYQRPDSSFRAGYAYTNFGMTEAAVAAAKAYDLIWEDASEQKLYGPLGMTATSSRYDDFMARDNKALGHVMVDGKWVHREQRQPDAQSPAGGVSSSVNDLTRWMRLQMNEGMFQGEQVIDADALAETHLPMMMTGLSPLNQLPQFYGLGWNVSYTADGRHRISHSGGFAMGTGTNVNISLDDDLGVVVLTNGAPVGVAEGLAANFMDDALYGVRQQDWLELYRGIMEQTMGGPQGSEYSTPPSPATSAAANAAYVGRYANDFFGDVEVVEKDGGLAVLIGPDKREFAMTHYDRDVFTFETIGENASGASGMFFTLDREGRASDLRIGAFDIHGEGTFVRK